MDMISGLRYAAAQKKAEEEAAAKAKAAAEPPTGDADETVAADESTEPDA